MLSVTIAILLLGIFAAFGSRLYFRRRDVLYGPYIRHDAQYDR